MLNSKRLKVLVAPLDWGLGHATRCIPIIKALIQKDYEVIIAAEGRQKNLLQEEFSSLQFIDLPGYSIEYGNKKQSLTLKVILQIPKILIQIKREKRWLNNYLRKEGLDLIISDNRFGLSSQHIYSVFITHQLYIETPFGKMISRILSALNYKFINRFSACWIPDTENDYSLAGILSHPEKLPAIPIRYMGWLTRFIKLDLPIIKESLLIIISGPEPQRSFFEKKLVSQIKNYRGKVTFIRGLPGNNEVPVVSPNVFVFNHLSTEALNRVICESEFVISRSGYTTIMDIVSLEKKCILIPTSGQPEQEYLAKYLFGKKIIFSIKEDDFVLHECLDTAKEFPFMLQKQNNTSLLADAIDELSSLIG